MHMYLRIALGATLCAFPWIVRASVPLRHPGVLVDIGQLSLVKARLAARDPVTTEAFEAMRRSSLARIDHVPKPHERVECGPYSQPDIGCTDEIVDAQVAYTQALLWALTGNRAHADKAIAIMDAWSGTLRRGHVGSNAPLQASWTAQLWPRAAEIIKHTSAAWHPDRVRQFDRMLVGQYLPDIDRMGRCHTFNWQASAIEARANIAIFLDDRSAFDEAIRQWRERAATSIYLAADGAEPRVPTSCPVAGEALVASWFGQRHPTDGHAQETCRDLEHTAYGIAALLNVAETASLQGMDLYAEEHDRLVAALEYHAALGDGPVPPTTCGGKVDGRLDGTLEIGFNHYAGRLGEHLPHTARWLSTRRPSRGYFHYLWETLTHAGD
ncbi:alginate lyase family protein [Luteibacter yeojuensis]